MTEYEINSLLSELTMHSRAVTEFWLACSFAVIVAVTYAPAKLEKKYFRLVSMGYLIQSVAFIALKIGYAVRGTELLSDYNYEIGEHLSTYINGAGGIALLLLMVFGTVAVLYYLRHSVRHDKE